MSTSTFTCLLPSYAYGSGYPFTIQTESTHHLTTNFDMSEEPGVQILDVRPKRTRHMSLPSNETDPELGSEFSTDQSWHNHFHPMPAERTTPTNTRNRPMPMLPQPPQPSSRHHPIWGNDPRSSNPFRPPNSNRRSPPLDLPRLISIRAALSGQEDNAPGEDSEIEESRMNNQSEVIDLTGDDPEEPPEQARPAATNQQTSHSTRNPRFSRPILANEVVDLVDEPDEPAEGPSSSPEVQFVSSSRRRTMILPAGGYPALEQLLRHGTRSFLNAGYQTHRPRPQGLSHEAAQNSLRQGASTDRLARSRARTRSSQNPMFGLDLSDETLFFGEYEHNYESRYQTQEDRLRAFLGDQEYRHSSERAEALARELLQAHSGEFQTRTGDIMLDYELPSFPMGPNTTEGVGNRGRPAYKPPSPAPEGFTATLTDEDVAICPNCECELGLGENKKQEIWVAKPCGHVYCGECADNRSKSKARKMNGSPKTPPKTRPFSKCQVPDCGKPVSSPTAMFHLFL